MLFPAQVTINIYDSNFTHSEGIENNIEFTIFAQSETNNVNRRLTECSISLVYAKIYP